MDWIYKQFWRELRFLNREHCNLHLFRPFTMSFIKFYNFLQLSYCKYFVRFIFRYFVFVSNHKWYLFIIIFSTLLVYRSTVLTLCNNLALLLIVINYQNSFGFLCRQTYLWIMTSLFPPFQFLCFFFFLSFSCLNVLARISSTVLNRSGDGGFLILFLILKGMLSKFHS